MSLDFVIRNDFIALLDFALKILRLRCTTNLAVDLWIQKSRGVLFALSKSLKLSARRFCKTKKF